MALTKTFTYKIEVNDNNASIGVRRADIILDDCVEIARSYHRSIFMPGDDLSEQPQEVQDIASVIWTDEAIDAYRTSTKEQ